MANRKGRKISNGVGVPKRNRAHAGMLASFRNGLELTVSSSLQLLLTCLSPARTLLTFSLHIQVQLSSKYVEVAADIVLSFQSLTC